jgi:hypothetical protein
MDDQKTDGAIMPTQTAPQNGPRHFFASRFFGEMHAGTGKNTPFHCEAGATLFSADSADDTDGSSLSCDERCRTIRVHPWQKEFISHTKIGHKSSKR